jgi:hypothetical protein
MLGVVQRVTGGLGSQISWHSDNEGVGVRLRPMAPLPLRVIPGTHFH